MRRQIKITFVKTKTKYKKKVDHLTRKYGIEKKLGLEKQPWRRWGALGYSMKN